MTTKLKSKTQELFEFDLNEAAQKKCKYIIGTDEAGRGPGAGPVFAAAVCFLTDDDSLMQQLELLNDSKKLTHKHREELYEIIIKNSVYSIQEGSVGDIDKKNILNTSLECMNKSCAAVIQKIDSDDCFVLVDGNRAIKNFKYQQKTVVKVDSKSTAIAAASILAKVSRDRFMDNLAKQYPQYGWEHNKGYLTAEHVYAIKQHGLTKWHRTKFVRNIQIEQESGNQLGLFAASNPVKSL